MNQEFKKLVESEFKINNCVDVFWVTTGYRKIPGDDC